MFAMPPTLGRIRLANAPRRKALGQSAQVAEALRARGPLIRVHIGVPAALRARLQQDGQPIPSAVEILAMVDTGASVSAIDAETARQIGLPQTGSMQIGGVGGISQQPVFAAYLSLPDQNRQYDPQTLAGANVAGREFAMLIGRDILKEMALDYRGPAGNFALIPGEPFAAEGQTYQPIPAETAPRPTAGLVRSEGGGNLLPIGIGAAAVVALLLTAVL